MDMNRACSEGFFGGGKPRPGAQLMKAPRVHPARRSTIPSLARILGASDLLRLADSGTPVSCSRRTPGDGSIGRSPRGAHMAPSACTAVTRQMSAKVAVKAVVLWRSGDRSASSLTAPGRIRAKRRAAAGFAAGASRSPRPTAASIRPGQHDGAGTDFRLTTLLKAMISAANADWAILDAAETRGTAAADRQSLALSPRMKRRSSSIT